MDPTREQQLAELIRVQDELDATYVVPPLPAWVRVAAALTLAADVVFFLLVGLPETPLEERLFYALGGIAAVGLAGVTAVYLRARRRRPALMERLHELLAEPSRGGSSELRK